MTNVKINDLPGSEALPLTARVPAMTPEGLTYSIELLALKEALIADDVQDVADILEPLLLTEGLPVRLGASAASVTDCDDALMSGFYQHIGGISNAPDSAARYMTVLRRDANETCQWSWKEDGTGGYFRRSVGGVFQAWVTASFVDSDIASKFAALTGAVFTGDVRVKVGDPDGEVSIEGDLVDIGKNRVGDGDASLGLHGSTGLSYSARLRRASGVNGDLFLEQTGTGDVQLDTGGGDILVNSNIIRDEANTPLFTEAELETGVIATAGVVSPAIIKAAAQHHAGMQLVQTWSHSSDVQTIPFTNLGDYINLAVLFEDVTMDTNCDILVQLSTDNGSSWLASGYEARAFASSVASTTVGFLLFDSQVDSLEYGGVMQLFGFNNAAIKTMQSSIVRGSQTANGFHDTAAAHDAFRLDAGSGETFTGGKIHILGMRG